MRVGLRLFRERSAPRAGVVVAGGVGANGAIRGALASLCAEAGLQMVAPPPKLCTDNGAMIAWAGIERLRLGPSTISTSPHARAGRSIRRSERAPTARRDGQSAPFCGDAGCGVLSGGPPVHRLLFRLLVGHVMADEAASDGAEHAVMEAR